jgi:hypothetical protein
MAFIEDIVTTFDPVAEKRKIGYIFHDTILIKRGVYESGCGILLV